MQPRPREIVRRALSSFLAIPTAVIIGFALLAVGTDWLDRPATGWLGPTLGFKEA